MSKSARRVIMAKALGFTNSIRELSSEERSRNPSSEFGEDYNRMIDAVSKDFPSLNGYLPPKATLGNSTRGQYTKQTYGEILTFSEQVYQLLAADKEE